MIFFRNPVGLPFCIKAKRKMFQFYSEITTSFSSFLMFFCLCKSVVPQAQDKIHKQKHTSIDLRPLADALIWL